MKELSLCCGCVNTHTTHIHASYVRNTHVIYTEREQQSSKRNETGLYIYLSLWYVYPCVYYTFVVLVSNLKSNIFSPFCVFILQVLQTRIVIFKLKFVYDIYKEQYLYCCVFNFNFLIVKRNF